MAHRASVLIDGKPSVSVTTFLSIYTPQFLLFWYGKYGTSECNRIKKESGEFGSGVHDCIEQWFKTGLLADVVDGRPLTERQVFLASLAVQWLKETKFIAHHVEVNLQCRELLYHGNTDIIGAFNNVPTRPVVMDWKTSNHFDEKMPLQLCAYALAFNEEHGLTWDTGVDTGVIIRLEKDPNKTPQIETREFPLLRNYLPVVKHLRGAYDYFNRKGIWSTLPPLK